MSNGIGIRQNEDKSIAMLAAQRRIYSSIKILNGMSIALSVWIPFGLSIILLFTQDNNFLSNGSYLLAIVSTVFSFIIDRHLEKKQNLAALIQQQFDTYVYTMPWDERVFGKNKNANHEIISQSKKVLSNSKEKAKLYNWYTPIVDTVDLNEGILFCQRENFWWDVGLRKRFRRVSVIVIAILFFVIFVMGLWENESVARLLCRFAFIIPMVNWFLNIVNHINKDIETIKMLDGYINDNQTKTMDDLQDIQKKIFEHRKGCYIIPDYFYKIFKNSDEDNAHREARL